MAQAGLSQSRAVGWGLLAVFVPAGGWLIWEIHRTIGLDAPRFWELLRDDRVFGLAMLDFFLTAAWALLVLIERAPRRDWRFWLSVAIFCVVPSLGIAVFLLTVRPERAGGGSTTGAG
ncbi:MAG: hypothetical protein KatS3mg108_0867 [Isosphaeraceae bacterium]|jgi:hypothetical protein|nr:MAG: hypothetical protein KatS3mg108_0867 [Isosphaeraceae bacterium]